jgi:CheY-like chemotaxis protein
LVEDDELLRGAMKMVLEWEGYRVAGAGDGREALDFLRGGERPSLILLDVMLPVLDARQAGCRAPVVVITGHGAEVEAKVRQVLAKGASCVLPKPLDVPALLATVQRLTGWHADGASPRLAQ